MFNPNDHVDPTAQDRATAEAMRILNAYGRTVAEANPTSNHDPSQAARGAGGGAPSAPVYTGHDARGAVYYTQPPTVNAGGAGATRSGDVAVDADHAEREEEGKKKKKKKKVSKENKSQSYVMVTNEAYIGVLKISYYIATVLAVCLTAVSRIHALTKHPNETVAWLFESPMFIGFAIVAHMFVIYVAIGGTCVVARQNVRVAALTCCGLYTLSSMLLDAAAYMYTSMGMMNDENNGGNGQGG